MKVTSAAIAAVLLVLCVASIQAKWVWSEGEEEPNTLEHKKYQWSTKFKSLEAFEAQDMPYCKDAPFVVRKHCGPNDACSGHGACVVTYEQTCFEDRMTWAYVKPQQMNCKCDAGYSGEICQAEDICKCVVKQTSDIMGFICAEVSYVHGTGHACSLTDSRNNKKPEECIKSLSNGKPLVIASTATPNTATACWAK